MKPIALITGASAGIGAELARVFAAHGHELVLVARRADRLNALAEEITAGGRSQPIVLSLDLEQRDALSSLAAELRARGVEPQFVVNNAGFGLVGRAATLPRLAMIDLNVRALTELSLAFVDRLARHRGGILNVASVAAFMPGPGMAVYYASKAYVLSFSEALHQELSPRGIKELCPGSVPTEFQARAGILGDRMPNVLTLSAARVVQIGYDGFMGGKRVVFAGAGNRIAVLLLRLMPHALLLPLLDWGTRRSTSHSERRGSTLNLQVNTIPTGCGASFDTFDHATADPDRPPPGAFYTRKGRLRLAAARVQPRRAAAALRRPPAGNHARPRSRGHFRRSDERQ